MKGIYLTEEGKKAIEEKIAELEKSNSWDETENAMIFARSELYKEILSSATILPVEDSWNNLSNNTFDRANNCEIYPQGVIIQPKQ